MAAAVPKNVRAPVAETMAFDCSTLHSGTHLEVPPRVAPVAVKRLPSECRLVDLQRLPVKEDRICRNDVAQLQLEQISRHEVLRPACSSTFPHGTRGIGASWLFRAGIASPAIRLP